MEIHLNFVLFEELKEKPDGGAEARIVILRESKDVASGRDASEPDHSPPE